MIFSENVIKMLSESLNIIPFIFRRYIANKFCAHVEFECTTDNSFVHGVILNFTAYVTLFTNKQSITFNCISIICAWFHIMFVWRVYYENVLSGCSTSIRNLFWFLFMYLFIYLSIYLFNYLFIYLFIYWFIYLFIYLLYFWFVLFLFYFLV